MDGSLKRKRAPDVPTLIYSAPGYNRFAKLFTESSLLEIKENVRKRLKLPSPASFTLFYDVDISLENEDDFAAFDAFAHSSSSSVSVAVKIVSTEELRSVEQSLQPAAEKATDSAPGRAEDTIQPSGSIVEDAVADPAHVHTKSQTKKRHHSEMSKDSDSISGLPEASKSATPVHEPPKKKSKKVTKNKTVQDVSPSIATVMEEDIIPSVASEKPKREKRKKKKQSETVDLNSTGDGKEQHANGIVPPGETSAALPSATKQPHATNKAKKNYRQDDSVEKPVVNPADLQDFWKEKFATPVISSTVVAPAEESASARLSKKAKAPHTSSPGLVPRNCGVCAQSPVHNPDQCPIVLAGPSRMKQRIRELELVDASAHSKVINELRALVQKSDKSNVSARSATAHVNTHSSLGGSVTRVPEASDSLAGPSNGLHVIGVREGASEDDSSDPEPVSISARKRGPVVEHLDPELDALIRDPMLSSAILDAMDFDDEEADRESVVLEEDNQDNPEFRRLSRRVYARAISSDDEEEDEPDETAEPEQPVSSRRIVPDAISTGALSGHQSTAPDTLTTIDDRQQSVVADDIHGDLAVDVAMANDQHMFGIRDKPSAQLTRVEPTRSSGSRFETPTREDDPIQPADSFSPIPSKPPATPRVTRQSKDRQGRTPLTQMPPPVSLINGATASSPSLVDSAGDTSTTVIGRRMTRTRSRTITEPTSVEPPKRKRGPNKTPQQREEEAAAKAAAKEEKERARKEKADAKVAAKKSATQKKNRSEAGDRVEDSTVDEQSKEEPATAEQPVNAEETPSVPQNTWVTLNPASSPEQTRDESMRDELRSSSAPSEPAGLFLPTESQDIGYPYSQWDESQGNHAVPQDDSDDEDDEDEVAASMQASQRQYRGLSEMMRSQPLGFGPSARQPALLPSTSTKTKNTINDMYGRQPDDDSSSDEDSEDEKPSHIPKGRRAGAKK